ncbi:hypothetical protein [Photobacterium sp.]|nr:hypothetical protein [Photobacterium sp.]MDX1304531.1 hypothetical protein [Photobacterium sp.]
MSISKKQTCAVLLSADNGTDESHPRRQRGLTRFAEEIWLIEK